MAPPNLPPTPGPRAVPEPRTFGQPFGWWIGLCAIVLIHLGLTLHFDPPAAIASPHPLSGVDFDTHIEQTWRVIEGIEGWGQPWVYDTHLLAGHPNGVIFDADNKGWELWTYGLTRLGVDRGLAFNLFIWLAHLLVLPFVYGASRAFRLKPNAALLATALASMVWFFDGFAHWCWWVGMTSYALASYWFVLPLGLFYRYTHERRAWQAVAVAVLMALGHLIHPYMFFIMAVPMVIMYIQKFRRLDRRHHLAIWGIAVFVVACNAYWLAVAFEFWHYILDSAFYGGTTLRFLWADFASLLLDPSSTGILGSRSGFRFIALGATLVMCVHWKRTGDDRGWPLGIGVGLMVALAYLGGYSRLLSQVQPYRHILPGALLAVIPAAALVAHAARTNLFSGLSTLARGLLITCLGFPAAQHLVRDILYFFPEEHPKVAALLDGSRVPVHASGYPEHVAYRHLPYIPQTDLLTHYVRKHDTGGRWLIQVGAVGEHLAWATDAEILGGFQHRNLEHAFANLFRTKAQGIITSEQWATYLERYAVEWLVVTFPRPWFDTHPNQLEYVTTVGPHRIYRSKLPVNKFARGSGTITAEVNRIDVRETNPNEPLVLRYHWLETLVCKPDC
ncbi:MAG: hypothetical protein ACPG77_08560, partial [Nannocystaceae bacterium]